MTNENITTELKGFVNEAGKVLHELRENVYTKAELDVIDKAKAEKLETKFQELRTEIENIKAVSNKPSANIETKADEEIREIFFKNFMAKGSVEEVKSLSAGSNADGGYTLPKSTLQLIEARIFETSPVERFANVVNTNGENYELIVDFDEADVVNGSETGAFTETATPELGLIRIPTKYYRAQPMATETILEDSAVNIETWLINKIADKFARECSKDFISGDGNGKPTGLLNANNLVSAKALNQASVYSSSKIEVFKTGSATVISADNMLDFIGKLKHPYRKGIFCNRETETALSKLKDGDNRYLFEFNSALGTITIRGIPVYLFEDMPSIGDGLNPIMAGDLKQAYTVVKRRGITILRDPYTASPYTKFKASKRIGGAPVVCDAIKVLRTAV